MLKLRNLISSVTSQLYVSAMLRCVLLAASAFLIASGFGQAFYWPAVLAAVAGLVSGAVLTGVFQKKKPKALALIHQFVGDTEYSLHLLEKDELNLAEQLQLERLGHQSDEWNFPYSRLYSGMRWYGGLFLLATVFYFAYPKIKFNSKNTDSVGKARAENKKVDVLVAPVYQSGSVTVNPPAYTKLPERRSNDLNISTITGSVVHWDISFTHQDNLAVKLANSRGEELSFKKTGDSFEYSDKVTGSGLYAVKAYWKDSLIYQSDFYRLEAIPDLPPKIEPVSKVLYKYHLLHDRKTIQLSAKISDDFRVRQAFIVATVARGSGENVKFREVKFPLSPSDFKEANLQKAIDLKALNFTPGDELYYYWAAVDNKQPEANFSKSDTYFLVYKDTAQVEEAELATMAVNIMPEYFRSQRQIIIDTEKLIAKREKLPSKEFNSVSNEIGFDQKVLRLRYGQYLGEEFETSIGGGGPPGQEGDHESGHMLDAFTHKSDGEGEAAERNASEPAHHDHESTPKGESQDLLAALMEQYVHAHDNAETNTFYEQSTRSLLKMALEQMWQSELHLRMYEPEKALPFEHKALEFLKSAQHKARTFVKKSGYDPPPIKEKEKRLSGELKEISNSLSSEKIFDEKQTTQLVAEILGYLDYVQINGTAKTRLQQAGAELSSRLINSGPLNGGLQNWAMISSLQKLVSGKTLSAKEKQQLKTELYKRSDVSIQSQNSYSSEKKLETVFRKRMQ